MSAAPAQSLGSRHCRRERQHHWYVPPCYGSLRWKSKSGGKSSGLLRGINCAAFFLRRRFRIEPLETKKRLRLLGAVLVSGSSNYARSCRLWHGSSQARLRLTDDLLIVIGNDPLHIDACAFDPRFVRQSLELKLNLFSLPGRHEGDGKSGGFACGGLNFHRVWVYSLV